MKQDVTRAIQALQNGEPHASDELVLLVYEQLRNLAVGQLRHERPGQTLQATALVHEAYLRLMDSENAWDNRGHFFAAAAEAMRRILIEQARRKASAKASGKCQRVDLSDIEPALPGPQLDMLALNDALEQLHITDPRAAAVVKLRFFAGLTTQEAARTLGVSLATAENDWAYAKCYLRLQLTEADGRPEAV